MDETDLAKSILKAQVVGEQVGLLTTADGRGHPHATWMATYAFVDHRDIITLSSPDSRKAHNISENPNVQWLFSSPDYEHLVYFTGKAFLEREPENFKRHWQLLPDKSHAYFLDTYNSPPGFAMIRTEVDKAFLVFPKESRSMDLTVAELLN